MFVWADHGGFAMKMHQQVPRYLVVAGLQYGATVAATRFLPAALGVSVTLVYVVTAMTLAAVSFLVLRSRVIHPRSSLGGRRR